VTVEAPFHRFLRARQATPVVPRPLEDAAERRRAVLEYLRGDDSRADVAARHGTGAGTLTHYVRALAERDPYVERLRDERRERVALRGLTDGRSLHRGR
jgi:transposase-like protein